MTHKHQCRVCQAVWQHTDEMYLAPREIWYAAHVCPAGGETNNFASSDRVVTHRHPVQVPHYETPVAEGRA